jgi:hypothetical protein
MIRDRLFSVSKQSASQQKSHSRICSTYKLMVSVGKTKGHNIKEKMEDPR